MKKRGKIIIAIIVILVIVMSMMIVGKVRKHQAGPENDSKIEHQVEDEDKLNEKERDWELEASQYPAIAYGEHLKLNEDGTFCYDDTFIAQLYEIEDGFYEFSSRNTIDVALWMALTGLGDDISGTEVYKRLCELTKDPLYRGYVFEDEAPALITVDSPYISERYGYTVGSIRDMGINGKVTYQGEDIWIDESGEIWNVYLDEDSRFCLDREYLASNNATSNQEVANNNSSPNSANHGTQNNQSNGNTANQETSNNSSSPYVSERYGYSVGTVMMAENGKDYTYQGKDIWVDSAGVKYTASDLGNGDIHLTRINEPSNSYPKYTFAKEGEVPVSERVGYSVGDSIKYESWLEGAGYERVYMGNDIWIDMDNPTTELRACLTEDGSLTWVLNQ